MRFHGQITAARWIDRFKPERTTVFEGYFDAPSIQAAKAHLTRLANKTELFLWVQSWDNEKRVYTGKDLRWRPWSDRMDYTDEKGHNIGWVSRNSEMNYDEMVSVDGEKYARHVENNVALNLRWAVANEVNP